MDRDTLADQLMAAIDQAELQFETEHGPPPPGYRHVVKLEHQGSGYLISVHRESVREIRVSVGPLG